MGLELTKPSVVLHETVIVRDGRAVTASYFRKNPTQGFQAPLDWYQPAALWVRKLIEDDGLTYFKYEDFDDAFLTEVSECFQLEINPNCMGLKAPNLHPISGNQGTISLIKANEGAAIASFAGSDLYTAHVDAGGASAGLPLVDERWREELSQSQLDMFDQVCGETNRWLGYID